MDSGSLDVREEHMGAFIIGGIIFIGTLLICALMIFAAGMSDNPSAAQGAGSEAMSVLIGGSILSALTVASHWMPHIGW